MRVHERMHIAEVPLARKTRAPVEEKSARDVERSIAQETNTL
jgi:hypothetical protein